jgi:hypothetical protein
MHQDFSELLAEFNAHNVEYLVVGAHALAAHGVVRATKDMDIRVNPSAENATRVLHAIAAFGAPLHDLTAEDLSTKGKLCWATRMIEACYGNPTPSPPASLRGCRLRTA